MVAQTLRKGKDFLWVLTERLPLPLLERCLVGGKCETDAARRRAVESAHAQARVLYVVNLNPSMKFGSMEEQIFLLSVDLADRGGLLLPVFAQEMDECQRLRYQSAGLPVISLFLGKFRAASLAQLIRVIDRYRIQVIHWNLYPPVNFYVPLLRLTRPKVRHVLTDHNSRPRSIVRSSGYFKRLSRKWFAAAYSGVFGVSNYVQADLKNQAIWRNPGRYHHFVNTERFKPDGSTRASLRSALDCTDRFVALVVAHLIPEKGVDIALRALAELPSRIVLWIAGDGPERSQLEHLAAALGVGDRTTFLGLRPDVCQYMQAADCLVCPSVWQEAAGLVILEAMACGLPVVASRVGGIPEFVISGQTGFLVPAGDHAAVATHLKSLSGSETLLNDTSRSARAHAEEHFSHKTRMALALSLYDPSS